MAPTPPATTADFKARFSRDFRYGSGLDTVQDNDITIAMGDAMLVFNPALFDTVSGKAAFLFAAAHCLVVNVQAAGGLSPKNMGLGMQNAPEEILTQKGAGNLNMSIEGAPEFILSNTVLRKFWTTDYGRNYIALLEPRIRGAFGAISGPVAPDIAAERMPGLPYSDPS